MFPEWKRDLEAMKNIAFTYPKHLHVFVCERKWAFICVRVCVCVSEQAVSAHTQGTRVLLISARAGERPLKVSLK